MEHHARQITSLLFILLLVSVGTVTVICRYVTRQITTPATFHQRFCHQSQKLMNMPPPRRQLCGVGVYINHDGEKALMYLPGIGPKRAKNIVLYRKRHGPFKSLKELENVHGIGAATVARFQPWIEDISE